MAFKEGILSIVDFLIKPRSVGRVFIIIVTLITINYTVFLLLSPIKDYKKYNASIDTSDIKKKMPALSNDTINTFIKEKAFYDSKLKSAKSDSLVLSVNFTDSIINIEIKGIQIHSIEMNKFDMPNFYSMIENTAFSQRFSEPQRIIQHYATAKKEPIKVVNAPKDTAEYNSSAINTNYDTSLIKLTYVEYETDKGFRMIFIPVEDKNFDNWKTAFSFNTKLALRNFVNGMKSAMLFEIPDYHPTAKIYLSQDDILSIHRALPVHAEVCIHY